MQTHRPQTPSMIKAAIRWNLAFQAAASAQVQPSTQSNTKAGDSGSVPRLPSCMPCIHSGMKPAASARHTSHSICHCRRMVLSMRRPLRDAPCSSASVVSKKRRPSKWCAMGADSA
ncbi:hypothetical protein D3C78_1436390 [compost metagenome]